MYLKVSDGYMPGLSDFIWSELVADLRKKKGFIDMTSSKNYSVYNSDNKVVGGVSFMSYWGCLYIDSFFIIDTKNRHKVLEKIINILYKYANIFGSDFILADYFKGQGNDKSFLLEYGFKIDFKRTYFETTEKIYITNHINNTKQEYETEYTYKVDVFDDMNNFLYTDNSKVFSIVVLDDNDNYIGGMIVNFKEGIANIDIIAVSSAMQGKGIGSMMMKELNEYCNKNSIQYKTLQTLSCQAMGFYKKQGFQLEYARGGYSSNLLQYYMLA